MKISAALLTIDLISSTRLSIENIFLMPSTGLSLSSLGVSFLAVTIGPTCRNSTSTPRNRASASSGSDSHTRVSNATYPTSRTPTSNGWPTAAMLASNSSCILRYMKPISSQPPTSQPSTSTVLVSSLDRKSVVEGKSVAVRVDLGGRSNNKKKKQSNYVQITQNNQQT